MIRFMKTMQKRRSVLQNDDKGFTLIELLVVVIIIGVLAAIAIPIYLGQQESAKNSAVKSDVANAKIALTAYQVDNPSATTVTLDVATLKDYGFTLGEYTDFLTTSVNVTTAFCVGAERKDVATPAADQKFKTEAGGGVIEGTC